MAEGFSTKKDHLTIRNLRMVRRACWEARILWMDIGIELDLNKIDLDAIRTEFGNDVTKCFTEMLTLWLKQVNPLPTQRALMEVLGSPSINLGQLAERIKKEDLLNELSSSEVVTPRAVVVPYEADNQLFPHINDIQDEQSRRELEQRLKAESEELRVQFCILMNKYFDSLEDQQYPIQRLIRHLKPYLETDCLLPEPKVIDDIMKLIEKKSSFFNYELIDYMIRLSGTNDDKQNLENYRTKFSVYAKRRVYESPAIISNLSRSETELHVKLDSKYDNCTVDQLTDFQSRLCLILKRNVYALRLLSVQKGCFKLVYAISDYIVKATFPLTGKQESDLAALGVLQLTCNDYQLKEVQLIETTGEDTVMLPKHDKPTYYRTECTYPKAKPTMYFHIQNKQEVRLIEATGEDTVMLPKRDKLTYYRTECTYPKDVNGSRFNDEQKSICLSHIDGRLKDFFTAMKEEPCVDKILFQVRFGNMYFTFPHHNAVVSTDDLQKTEHNKFSFSIPGSVNLQTFLKNHCANISQVTRYKVKFKIFADDASSLVKAGCHIEEQGDTFTHIWTRVSVKDEIEDSWRDVRHIDIICPGRNIDMHIVGHFQTPCCPEDHPARKIGERIAKSMTRNKESGRLFMQVAAEDFCVVFIRKKNMKKCSWIDPTQRNPGWTITELCAHNPRHMEYEYLRLRRDKHYSPVPVDIDCRVVTELDFSGSTHATKPSDDPNSRVPTPDEFVADFKAFVEASFCVADQLN